MPRRVLRLARQAYYWLKDYPLYRRLSFLDRSQYYSRTEMEALQDEKLRLLIDHAYRHVPYYRQVMESRRLAPQDIRGVGDLWKLPVLTREEIRANAEQLLSTSGSSGKAIWNK